MSITFVTFFVNLHNRCDEAAICTVYNKTVVENDILATLLLFAVTIDKRLLILLLVCCLRDFFRYEACERPFNPLRYICCICCGLENCRLKLSSQSRIKSCDCFAAENIEFDALLPLSLVPVSLYQQKLTFVCSNSKW